MVTNSRTILRFLFVGIVNTFVGLGVIFAAKGIFGMGDVLSNASGYGIGFLVSFSLNRHWTFRHSGSVLRAMASFLAVQAVAYSLNLACVLGWIEYGIDSYVAQALGMPPYMVISYLGSRYFAFAPGRKLRSGTFVSVIPGGPIAPTGFLKSQNSGRPNNADGNF